MKRTRPYLLKKYENIYRREPKSRVFVLLADIYRQNEELAKALKICQEGLKKHPNFSAGYTALAMIFIDKDELKPAVQALEKAVQLTPESLQTYKLLGSVYRKLKDPLNTLRVYKKILFLEPKNKSAGNIVKKLEVITSAQYDSAGFAFKNLEEISSVLSAVSSETGRSLEVIHPIFKSTGDQEEKQFAVRLSMIKALFYRNKIKKARWFLQEMNNIYGHQENYKKYIQYWENKLGSIAQPEEAAAYSSRAKKIRILRHFLRRINQHENSSLHKT